MDAPGGPEPRQLELARQPVHGPLRRVAVERHRPAGEVVGVQVAEQQVRVGDRRRRAAPPVAGGPRVGAGAARPDLQDPERRVRDRAAAAADLDQVDRGDVERQPAAGP